MKQVLERPQSKHKQKTPLPKAFLNGDSFLYFLWWICILLLIMTKKRRFLGELLILWR